MFYRNSLSVVLILVIVSLVGHCVDIPVVLPPNASALGSSDLQRLTQQIERLREVLISLEGLGSQALYAEMEWQSANFATYSGGILSSFGYHVLLVEGYSTSQEKHTWLLVKVPTDGPSVWIPVEASPDLGQRQYDIGFIPTYADKSNHLWYEPEYMVIQKVSELPVNTPPTAHIRPQNTSIETGEHLLLLGISSADTDGNIVLVLWEFGDDSADTSTVLRSRHEFTNPGTYTVTMTVFDNQGASASATTQVAVISSGMPEPPSSCGCGG